MTCCFLVVDLVVWVTMVAVLKRIVATGVCCDFGCLCVMWCWLF